jgi:hypothetical protein
MTAEPLGATHIFERLIHAKHLHFFFAAHALDQVGKAELSRFFPQSKRWDSDCDLAPSCYLNTNRQRSFHEIEKLAGKSQLRHRRDHLGRKK